MLQPIYTMNGFNWFDRRGVEGVGFVKTLRTLLTNNLPQLLPNLGVATRVRFDEHRSRHAVVNGTIWPNIFTKVCLSLFQVLFIPRYIL
jgi:hypothetical protein